MKRIIFLMVMIAIFLGGCAIVDKPEIRQIESDEPVISKTLEAENDFSINSDVTSLKRKVTIVRFSNETRYGKGNLFKNDDQQIGRQAMDILSTKLTKTGKFLMFERPELEGFNFAEFDSSDFTLASDYIVVGSVSEFGRANTSDVGLLSRTKKQNAHAKVNIRLINLKTGQVIYAEEGSGEAFSEVGTVLGTGSRAGYDSSLNDKAIDAAISKLVSNIVENLLNEPWKAYILDNTDGQIIMSGGKSQNIKTGDKFAVIKKGKMVKNPQTGIEIELPGEKLGVLQVDTLIGNTLTDEVSICTMVEGTLGEEGISKLYIAELKAEEKK